MCGIFGIVPGKKNNLSGDEVISLFESLALLSESRGKESAGAVFLDGEKGIIDSLKGPISATGFLKSSEYKKITGEYKLKNNYKNFSFVMGHSRLVTNGTHLKDFNNQPTVKDGLVGIHNGIIVNEKEIWENNKELKREYQVDTEVMLALLSYNYRNGSNLLSSVKETFPVIKGTVSTSILFNYSSKVLLFTNNGSLYILKNKKTGLLIFASEKYFLKQLKIKFKDKFYMDASEILQLKANEGRIIDLATGENFEFNITPDFYPVNEKEEFLKQELKIIEASVHTDGKALRDSVLEGEFNITKEEQNLLEFNFEEISRLKRCVKCLLPETFPFIEFDAEGMCNICNNYKQKNQPKPITELYKLIEPYRRKGEPDCIIPFSGGRDSSYTVHFVKKELGLNPITFTYDWGMVTDLARRNIARICGKLGIENIIVSADIRKKREFIRKNITAWLKNPKLGMVPLFMAGDKYFYYYTKKLKEQINIELNVWGINTLENTDFKVGFCGVKLNFEKKTNYSLNYLDKLQLLKYVSGNVLKNPDYLNASMVDSIGSFFSRYFFPQKDYYHLFDYVPWDENEIEKVIINDYDWETAPDTKSTWRIGDGTAGFYNYIYYTVAGFSEHETFRSNQIREGLLSREEGMELIRKENFPRIESIKWYLSIIGLDFMDSIRVINKIPKLYRKY